MNITGSHTQAQSCPISSNLAEIGREKPSPEKTKIIRSMIRQAPDCEAVDDVVEALSAYPQEALERVADYGTKLEVYNEKADEIPNYMPTLSHAQVVGAYNTAANVLGAMSHNLSPFVLLHEFAHALDASLGEISEEPQWKGGHNLAQNTGQVVRDYAKYNPSEYFAENTSAYLVSDDALYPLVEKGLEEGLGIGDLSEREYLRMHQNYSRERLERVDPNGFSLVDGLFQSLEGLPEAEPKPAMTEQQYQEFIDSRPKE